MLLWIAFFLHQGDRQIYNVVIPLIKSGLNLTDVQVGFVGSIFTLVYGVLVPVAGFAGDRFRRKWIVVMSLILFSAGTLCTGFSASLVWLVIFRSVATGGGEAFYYPAATSLLAQHHPKTRALALSIHQTALYAGIIASGWLAGYIGEHWGWRATFFSFGLAGLAWAVVVLVRLRDTAPPQQPEGAAAERVPVAEALRYMLSRPSVWLLSLAFGAMVYVNVGYLTWTPTFLHEQFGLSLSQAGFSSMFYHNAAAFVGVLLGGRITDRLAQRHRWVRMGANFAGLLLGAPFIFWLGHTGSARESFVALACFGIFRGIYDSNLFASLFDVVEPRVRASATGLMLSFAFIVGSLAPTVLGWMKMHAGLAVGISSLAWCYLFGAVCIFVALRFFLRRDFVIPNAETAKAES